MPVCTTNWYVRCRVRGRMLLILQKLNAYFAIEVRSKRVIFYASMKYADAALSFIAF